jgi:hypothetical protein
MASPLPVREEDLDPRICEAAYVAVRFALPSQLEHVARIAKPRRFPFISAKEGAASIGGVRVSSSH